MTSSTRFRPASWAGRGDEDDSICSLVDIAWIRPFGLAQVIHVVLRVVPDRRAQNPCPPGSSAVYPTPEASFPRLRDLERSGTLGGFSRSTLPRGSVIRRWEWVRRLTTRVSAEQAAFYHALDLCMWVCEEVLYLVGRVVVCQCRRAGSYRVCSDT